MTPILKNLHLLVVTSQIKFENLITTLIFLHNLVPSNLMDTLHRDFHSDNSLNLNAPFTRLQLYGGQAFSRAATFDLKCLANRSCQYYTLLVANYYFLLTV